MVDHSEALIGLAVSLAASCAALIHFVVKQRARKRGGASENSALTQSDRHRALKTLDTFNRERLLMPPEWEKSGSLKAALQSHIDARAQHQIGNVLQERVMPLLDRHAARLSALEPDVAALERRQRESDISAARLETKVDGLKESVDEVKEAQIASAERTHELLGRLAERMGVKS